MKKTLKKTGVVVVRFKEEDKRELIERADAQYQSLSEFIRNKVLKTTWTKTKIVPQINRTLYFQLGEIAEYIQTLQIATEARNQLQESLDRIRSELIGLQRVREE
ncbi:MAG: hypothetical protein N5P05_004504 (plasmid) [Chroococcopsis gigantea SAG 12.99]|jgi:uncharacterized protein (DUF1778 family)|nr:hypothetical protein [Chroococcopsis gigantea SAG 12.99]